MSDVTCGQDNCCWFFDGDWCQTVPASRQFIIGAKFCRKTGVALRVVDGQPVVEPRPSPEYVRLLEEAVRDRRKLWYVEWLEQELPAPCYQRVTHHGPAPCDHDDPPIGCLRALAEARQAEGGETDGG